MFKCLRKQNSLIEYQTHTDAFCSSSENKKIGRKGTGDADKTQEKSTASVIADARLARLETASPMACSFSNESVLSRGKNEPLDNILDCLEALETKAERVVAQGAAVISNEATSRNDGSPRESVKSK